MRRVIPVVALERTEMSGLKVSMHQWSLIAIVRQDRGASWTSPARVVDIAWLFMRAPMYARVEGRYPKTPACLPLPNRVSAVGPQGFEP